MAGSERCILYVRNLPFGVSRDDMYAVFGEYGTIRQIRVGNGQSTRGSAYVVYNDPIVASSAADALNGYNLHGRYMKVSFFSQAAAKRSPLSSDELAARRAELEALKEKYGLEADDE